MKAPLILLEGDQLEIDFDQIGFDLDHPQLSICPQCDSKVIRLADCCDVCGWREQRAPSIGSYSISCTIKQPKQPECKGVIRKDLGSRFLVYLPDSESTVTVPKLFVYPDFPQLDKSSSKQSLPSKNCSSNTTPPCKTRRQKGEGSGHIYYRTVIRNGKDYQQAYYQWREDGKQRTKYIPKKLLDKVKEAESAKLPVADILEILQGGLKKCSSKKLGSFSNEKLLTKNKSAKTSANCSSKITSPPCNLKRAKRQQGHGAGYVECRKVKRGSKLYSQYWYHYEEWWEGDRYIKSSKYIPREKEGKVIRMNSKKAPVEKILKVLESKSKGRKK
ncbi:MAG: hypothetical protein AB4372_13360 [Xenococcus sp. (in: cyanobacteria)]